MRGRARLAKIVFAYQWIDLAPTDLGDEFSLQASNYLHFSFGGALWPNFILSWSLTFALT
jgi:hypothetical protein